MNAYEKFMVYSPEVKAALEGNLPVVALESTIISHGMPYPENVRTARAVEGVIRDNGAVPATIGIIGGKIRIGLASDELEYFGKARDVVKVSRRDLPAVISAGKNGGTTVAGTMICAAMAGIRIFVTGGIGGVHRGAETSFDISADLSELKETSVAVVCAGVKSILDIRKTLEYLETAGVPVVGFGTDDFPAFYTRSSGLKVDCRLDNPEDIARLLNAKWEMSLRGGVVIAVPIPEEHAMDGGIISGAIEEALRDAGARHIEGKDITPFLLGRIKELTGGESLDSNIALIRNNAVSGARIAVEYHRLVQERAPR